MAFSLQQLLLSSIAPLCWGISWLLLAKVSKKMDVYQTQFIFQLAGIPMLLILLPFLAPFTIHNYAIIIGLGILVTFTYTLYFYALKKGQLAVIAPIFEAYILVTVFLAVIFLHESFYLLKLFAIISIIVGVAFLGIHLHALKQKKIQTFAGVVPAVIASLGTGFSVFFTGISSRLNGWYANALGIRLVIPFVIILLFLIQRKKISFLFKNAIWKWIIPAAVVDVIAFSMFNYTLGKYEVSYVTVMGAAAPIFSTFLAILFLKERLSFIQILGFILVITGIVFLNIV